MVSIAAAQRIPIMVSTNREKYSKFRYSVVMRVTLLMSLGALVWIVGMMQIDAWSMMLVPAGYLVFSATSFFICKAMVRPDLGCKIQMIISILFPCLFQVIAGGTMATGAVMVWSIVALFSVGIYSPGREAILWAIYTMIVLVITLSYENSPFYHYESILEISPVKLLLFNVLSTFSIIFYIGFFFVRTVESVRAKLSMTMDEVKALNSSLQLKNDIYIEGMKHSAEIQNAFMKREDQLRTVFTKVFLLREVYNYVSGDFIWAEAQGGYNYVICGDCRTTGSSRAMLAMLMVTTANRILNEQKYTDPGQFLTAFNQAIHEMSSLDLANVEVNVALSMLIIKQKTAEARVATAGGKIMVRSAGSAEQSTVRVHHVDTNCLGGADSNSVFRSEQLDLDSGDMVYMFTDGLVSDEAERGVIKTDELKDMIRNFDTEYMFSQKRRLMKEIKQANAGVEDCADILVCGFEVEKE